MIPTGDKSAPGKADSPPIQPPSSRSRLFRVAALAVQLAVSAILIAVLLRQFGDIDLIGAFETVSVPTLGGVAAILVLQYFIGALRLRMIISYLGGALKWRFAIRVTFVGIFFSQTFVSFIGGDGMRIWQLARSGWSYRTAGHAIAADRILGFISLVAVIVVGLPLSIAHTTGETRLSIIVLAAISAITCVLFFRMARLPAWARRRMAGAEIEDQVALCWDLIRRDPRTVLVFVSPHVLNTLILYLFLLDFGATVSFPILCALFPAVILLSMLPVSFAGWGVREGALMVAVAGLEIDPSIIIGASIAFGLSIFLASLPGALLTTYPNAVSDHKSNQPPQ